MAKKPAALRKTAGRILIMKSPKNLPPAWN